MRAGWIMLKIRHKQYGVNVDEVGADIIRPQIPQSAALTAPFDKGAGWGKEESMANFQTANYLSPARGKEQ